MDYTVLCLDIFSLETTQEDLIFSCRVVGERKLSLGRAAYRHLVRIFLVGGKNNLMFKFSQANDYREF